MIKDLVNNWEKRKGLIRDALMDQLREEGADKYCYSYKDLVILVWGHVLDDHKVIPFNNLYVVDLDDSYSGDYVYILRHWDNIYGLRVEYGSCSACDSLEYALEHGIDDLMSLALHIVQETKEL